jgi:hypothetical protein
MKTKDIAVVAGGGEIGSLWILWREPKFRRILFPLGFLLDCAEHSAVVGEDAARSFTQSVLISR